jgi:DNA-binding PadR family transcriptional regulator
MDDDREDKLERELDRTAKLILQKGPMSVYQAQKYLEDMKRRAGEIPLPGKKNPPLGTVRDHFETLAREGEIEVYRKEKSGRKQKYYGLTLFGFLWNLSQRIVEKHFAQILDHWLRQEEFEFFLPKEEVLKAVTDPIVASALGQFCLMVSDSMPDADDLLEFLEVLGFDASDPKSTTQLLLYLAGGIGIAKGQTEFISIARVLCDCKELPTFRKRMKEYIESQHSILTRIESEIGLR